MNFEILSHEQLSLRQMNAMIKRVLSYTLELLQSSCRKII